MSVSTPLPKTTRLRRSHPFAAIAAIVTMIALVSWAIATYVVHSGTHAARSSAASQASVLRSLTPRERQYVLGILSLTPAELSAAFGTTLTSVPGARSGSAVQPARSSSPTLASVLRSLTPRERQYVMGILSLTPAQLRAAFGTGLTSAHGAVSGSTPAPTATTSRPVALPILPACRPGPCWRAATGARRPAHHEQ
jgi:hypothetical protein